MRFSANEDMPRSLIAKLRTAGHDVHSVKESTPGANDEEVLAHAVSDHRIVLTQDKDFGELAVRFGLPAECGVVLFRLNGRSPKDDADRMNSVLCGPLEWRGCFSVVTHDRIRQRPIIAKP